MDAEALGRLIRAGEGPTIEWKRELNDPDRAGAVLAAFANGIGGRLVVGVADDASLVGLTDPEAAAAVLEEAASRLLPRQEITLSRIESGDRTVVVAAIEPAARPPVRMWHTDGSEVAYIREGASTRRAEKDDLRALSSAQGRDRGEDPLNEEEARALREILRMKNTAMKAVINSLHRGRREGRLLLKRLQRRGYLVRKSDGRFALTPFAHQALDRLGL